MKTLAQVSSRAEILQRLKAVRPDSPRRWGRMSAPQMICHLADAYRMANGDKRVTDASSLVQRTAIKWIALYAPVPWPPGILTRPEIDQEAGGGTCPGDFASDVADLAALVRSFGRHRTEWPLHPIFGKMSTAQWLRWGYLHSDHHLRQFGA